jgi:SAM-dependent methyltransferase
MPGANIFDLQSDRYEAWFEKNNLVYQSEFQAIKTLMPGHGRSIEIGVGSGLFAGPLGITMGIDPSRAMLDKAKARGILTFHGVAEALPFESEFDTVLMVTTVCFLDDIDLAFREVRRILNPGGVFLIGFVDKKSPIGRSYEEKKDRSLFYRDAVFYSVTDLQARLVSAGFNKFRFAQTLFHLLPDIKEVEPVYEGYGKGSFVVIRSEF